MKKHKQKKENATVQIRITPSLHYQLRRLAFKKNASMSEIIKELIKENK